MGMVKKVRGFVLKENETHKKQVKVLEACIDAGISELPKETAEYFGGKYPEKHLIEEKTGIELITHNYERELERGYEIIMSEHPDYVYKELQYKK